MGDKHDRLVGLIEDVVGDSNGTWQDKRDAILKGASERQITALMEFVSWFEEPAEHNGIASGEDGEAD